MHLRDALSRLLPVRIGLMALTVSVTLAVAGDTQATTSVPTTTPPGACSTGSRPTTSYVLAGAGGLFYYPPTFVPLVLPFTLAPVDVATWLWTGLLLVAFAIAVVAMPIGWRTRWWIVLLAALSWPFVYNIKLGQVGPLLVLLFALAWRWRDRPVAFGVAAGLGAAIKVQPGLLLVWALLRRRLGAVAAGAATLLVVAALALVVAGVDAWPDFLGLVTRVSDPIASPQNMTPGAVAWQMGAARPLAEAIQVTSTVAVIAVFLAATIWLPEDLSLMVAIVASQLISPILWDHYAIVLLVPVAWLLERGRRWALVIPLLTPVVLVGVTPAFVYPLVFGATLLVVAAEGYRDRGRPSEVPTLLPAG